MLYIGPLKETFLRQKIPIEGALKWFTRLSRTAPLPQHEASFTCRCNTYYLLCSWGFISDSDSRWKVRRRGDAISGHGPRQSPQTQTAAVAAAYAEWSSQTPAFDSGLWTGAKMWHVLRQSSERSAPAMEYLRWVKAMPLQRWHAVVECDRT